MTHEKRRASCRPAEAPGGKSMKTGQIEFSFRFFAMTIPPLLGRLYAAIGVPHCPQCGIEISRQSAEQILQQIMALKQEDRVMILAPIVRGRKGEYKKDIEKLARQGFVRARIDGTLRSFDEEIVLDRRKNHTIEVVVDRLLLRPGIEQRPEASMETASKPPGGLVRVGVANAPEKLSSLKARMPQRRP